MVAIRESLEKPIEFKKKTLYDKDSMICDEFLKNYHTKKSFVLIMKMDISQIFYPANGTTFFVGTLNQEDSSINLSIKGNWQLFLNNEPVCIVEIGYEYMPIRKKETTFRTLVSTNFVQNLECNMQFLEVILVKI